MAPSNAPPFTDEEALAFHAGPKPGKLEITPTKPMATQRDLSLAYSPGVAVPVPGNRGKSRRRLTTIPPSGNHGGRDLQRHRHSGPGRSGRAGRQAGDGRQGGAVQALRRCRRASIWKWTPRTSTSSSIACAIWAPAFGGINLEDIKAPDCFIIEQRLREMMDIPVFHDDQHGTAIIAAAGV